MRRKEFEKLVLSAIRKLPERFRRELEQGNILIVVRKRPSLRQLQRLNINPNSGSLFGLYEGVPLTSRSSSYNMILPDRIIIFKEELEDAFPDELALKEQIRRTALHEIAHFFGIDDAQLKEMGWG